MDIPKFMQEYMKGTKPPAASDLDYRNFGTVRLTLEERPVDVYIWRIINVDQGNGQASKALDWLCGLADKYGVPLELFPERMNGYGKGVPTVLLKKWYGSRGFEKDAKFGFYRREPKVKIRATYRLIAGRQLRILRKNPPKPYFVLRYLHLDDQDKASGRIYTTIDKDHLVGLDEADKFKSRENAKKFLSEMGAYKDSDFYIEQII